MRLSERYGNHHRPTESVTQTLDRFASIRAQLAAALLDAGDVPECTPIDHAAQQRAAFLRQIEQEIGQ